MGLIEKMPNPKSCFIESLMEIGWLDPFPYTEAPVTGKKVGAKKMKKENAKNLDSMYQSTMDYIENLEDGDTECKSCVSFCLPSKSVMIKIMRACISVDKPQKLWIYNENSLFG